LFTPEGIVRVHIRVYGSGLYRGSQALMVRFIIFLFHRCRGRVHDVRLHSPILSTLILSIGKHTSDPLSRDFSKSSRNLLGGYILSFGFKGSWLLVMLTHERRIEYRINCREGVESLIDGCLSEWGRCGCNVDFLSGYFSL
jgi:hypothetical protein